MGNWLLAIGSIIGLGALLAILALLILPDDWGFAFTLAGVTMVICASGGLVSYLNYKRGQIYAKRDQSGPDG